MHWPFDFAQNPFEQQQGFTSMNTVDDISYCPSTEEKARNAKQAVVTGRRNWKLLKGKKEAVWPPNIEAVLLEALKFYRPHSSKPLVELGRFPMRNRFISDYIYEVTGKRRTPKQVGSRLQQLRDTCKKVEILNLISSRNRGKESSKTVIETSSFQHPQIPTSTPPNSDEPSNIIDVEVILDDEAGPLSTPAITLTPISSALLPLQIRLVPLDLQNVCTSAFRTDLSGRDPTVEIHSPCPLFNQTIFSVFCESSDKPIHYEVGLLSCHSSPPDTCTWIYSLQLVPTFWSSLCNDQEPTKYTVQQGIVPLSPLPGSRYMNSPGENEPTTTLSYRFILPPKVTNIEREAEVYPLSTIVLSDLPSYPHQGLEKYETFHHEGPWPSYQNLSTVNQNFQICDNSNSDAVYPAPFSYISSGWDNGYDGHVGSDLQQRSCYNCSPWSPQPVFLEGNILPNTCFHHVRYSTLI